jgi:hypothetical protein
MSSQPMKKSGDSTIWEKVPDSTEQLPESQNEKTDWSRYTPWRELIRTRLMAAFASYRPELHYMRGRGPKWREKH